MSKDLGVVQGDATRWISDVQTTIDNELIYACSFFGGKERSACLQLTIVPNNYIELTRTGVADLAEILVKWLEDHPESIRNRIDGVTRKIDTELDKPRY